MPRRRKNKKNRKGNARKSKNQKNSNSALLTTNDVMRTCFDDDSFNRSRPVSPLELVTPLKTPYQKSHNTDPFEDELSPIRTTPVNRKRSLNVPERKKYSSLNVTNLNILFDSNISENISRSKSDISISNSSNSYKKRSNSSIPKLHSPIVENSRILQENHNKPSTAIKRTSEVSKANEILETPRVSKILLLDRTKSDDVYNMPPLNNHRSISDKVNNNSKNMKFCNGEVNINPYLNNREIHVNKDGSVGEISFFSSNLFEHKSSSTPIDKLHEANSLMNYVKDSLKKDNVNECVGVTEKIDLPNNLSIIPNMETNLNLNKTPLSEKVLYKEHSMKSLRQPVSLTKRRSYRTSPNSNKILTQTRIFNNRRHTVTYSRLNISRRSSVDSVESVSRHSRSGIGEKLLTRLKKYTKASQRWSVKVMELCTQLGVQLKNSLSSMCNLYNDKTMLEDSDKPTCKCEEYREEISQLNLKIEELTEEVRTVKLQLQQERTNKENIEILNQELNKVREELSQFKDLRTEMELLKEQLKCLKPASVQTSVPIPPPPPLPSAPPPPPPPPPMPLSMPDCAAVKILRKAKAKSICTDNSRPIISLDDILKVKLKKTSERANSLTPMTRRLSQPVISTDMLRQVKLKPASRPSFRPDTPDTGASTSPHSSLCRKNVVGKRERDGS